MRTIELKEAQVIQLNILKETVEICNKFNLKYYLSYGTLLGSIRHKGFIPWDDDVDIVMPRTDYEVLIHKFNNHCGENFRLIHYSNSDEAGTVFSKIEDVRTCLIESNTDDKKQNTGLFIDVFPLDNCGNSYFLTLMYYYFRIMPFKRISMGSKLSLSRKRNPLKQFVAVIAKKLCEKYNASTFMKIADKNAKQYGGGYNKPSSLITSFLAGYGKHEIHKADWYQEGVLKDFEDTKFVVPRDWDSVLKSLYQDYMKLPPLEQQKPKHTILAYWRDEK